jgi:hypothetical protein
MWLLRNSSISSSLFAMRTLVHIVNISSTLELTGVIRQATHAENLLQAQKLCGHEDRR